MASCNPRLRRMRAGQILRLQLLVLQTASSPIVYLQQPVSGVCWENVKHEIARRGRCGLCWQLPGGLDPPFRTEFLRLTLTAREVGGVGSSMQAVIFWNPRKKRHGWLTLDGTVAFSDHIENPHSEAARQRWVPFGSAGLGIVVTITTRRRTGSREIWAVP